MKTFTLVLTDYEVSSLLWLVEGNNAFTDLAQKLSDQIDEQIQE